MITARSSPTTSGASNEEASVCESAPKAVIVIEASSVSRAKIMIEEFVRDWPRQSVYKKLAGGQVFLFLRCESRQVSFEQAFFRAAFQTERLNRNKIEVTESLTGF